MVVYKKQKMFIKGVNMPGVSILMFIFAICIFLTGLYMFTGHKLGVIAWKAAFKGLTKEGWKNVGKWTMITSVIPLIIGIICLFIAD